MRLQLHRTGSRPQWADMRPADRNAWQRLAAASGGVLTPGNFFTIVGFGLAAAGLGYAVAAGRGAGHGAYFGVAFALVVLGRLCDVLDGWLAELTGTKSPLGEILDAGFDKLLVVAGLPVLVIAAVIPWWAAAMLILPHLVIAGISAWRLGRGGLPHPSKLGKVSMAAAWVALSLAVLVAALRSSAGFAAWLAYAAGIASVVLGWLAAAGYGKASKTARP